MKDKITGYLINRGYTELGSSIPELDIFFRVDGILAMVFLTIDLRSLPIGPKEYEDIKLQVFGLFSKKGYQNIRIFSLFAVNDINRGKMFGTLDPLSWVLELPTGRLCIFENEVADFDNLRFGLEGLISESTEISASGRKTVGKWLHDGLFLSKAPLTLSLILLNSMVFLALSIFGSTSDVTYMVEHGALYTPLVLMDGQVYRLFTCMFLHFGLEHLVANMLSLWIFGERVENALGKAKLLFIYIFSGLFGSFLSLLSSIMLGSEAASAGASGAIFGIIGALFGIVTRNKGRFGDLTSGRVALLIGYSVMAGMTGQGIDNAAHIGGLIMGFVLGLFLYRTPAANKNIPTEGNQE